MTSPTRTRTRTRARRGDGAKLRAQVLDVAEALLLEAGTSDAVSMRTIAEGCAVTPPAIYLHFPDKETLFREVCDRRMTGLGDAIATATAGVTDPLDALRLMGLAYVGFALEHPETYRAVLGPRATEGGPAARATFDRLAGFAAAATDQGALDGQDPRAAALVIWSGLHGIASLMLSFPELEWGERDAFVEHALDVLIEGLLSV